LRHLIGEYRGRDLRSSSAMQQRHLRLAYNSHPRIVDFNQDGRLDLLLGVNWGTVSLYLNTAAAKKPSLSSSRLLQWSDGTTLNIRKQNGDDTTPEPADFDGDGVLDVISGGKNGRLFFMRRSAFRRVSSRFKVCWHNTRRVSGGFCANMR